MSKRDTTTRIRRRGFRSPSACGFKSDGRTVDRRPRATAAGPSSFALGGHALLAGELARSLPALGLKASPIFPRMPAAVRIVSFLPAATEIVYALGAEDQLVGVTNECDFPPQARMKPVVVRSA